MAPGTPLLAAAGRVAGSGRAGYRRQRVHLPRLTLPGLLSGSPEAIRNGEGL